MACAVVVTAQFTAGKATRDALYLANLDVTALPSIVAAAAVVSVGVAVASARHLRRWSPATVLPLILVVSAVLLIAGWALMPAAPRVTAALLYLQISSSGPVFGSQLWLIVSERFDPRSAKRRFGQIASAGTLGGLMGGIIAERVGDTFGLAAMLPTLAALDIACALAVRRLGRTPTIDDAACRTTTGGDRSDRFTRSGFRVISAAPYLRNLAMLVVLGTLGAALVDYVFKAEAVAALGHGQALLRFFGIYYAVTCLITFTLQTSSSRFVLQKLGVTAAAGAPSLALFAGGLGGLLLPGLGMVSAIRGSESVLRASFFRSGYEIFYTPIPQADRRAAKSLIDVGADRVGEALGAVIIQGLLILGPAALVNTTLAFAAVASLLALLAAQRLNSGYVNALQESLLNRAMEMDLSDAVDFTTRTAIVRTVGRRGELAREAPREPSELSAAAAGVQRDIRDSLALRSRDLPRVIAVLTRDEGISGPLVAHTIPLLAWDAAAEAAIRALQRVAEERIGELTDALIDPNQPFAVRRRLARAVSVCVSQRACDGLLLALDDPRFEVRFQAGRSLAAILQKNPLNRIDQARVHECILREVTVSPSVWQSRRLLDHDDDPNSQSDVDAFLRDRTNRGLSHVFTLLSLVLPAEPLLIAYRGLQTDNAHFKGTALEYLESVLPPVIRARLWPFLDSTPTGGSTLPNPDAIVADLLNSHPSILLHLKQLRA